MKENKKSESPINPNLCEKCHSVYGCGRQHSFAVADTGICGRCGQTAEVWDCELLNLYGIHGISEEDVSKYPRLRYRNGKEEITLKEVKQLLDTSSGSRQND